MSDFIVKISRLNRQRGLFVYRDAKPRIWDFDSRDWTWSTEGIPLSKWNRKGINSILKKFYTTNLYHVIDTDPLSIRKLYTIRTNNNLEKNDIYWYLVQ